MQGILGWDRLGRAAGACAVLSAALVGSPARVLAQPPPAADAGVAGDAGTAEPPPPRLDTLADMRAELDRQRAELEAQRVELEQQRAELEAQRAGLEEQAVASGDDAELEAILADVESEAEVDVEPLRLYGFMDVGLQRTWGSPITTSLAATTETTFVLGNLNLYVDAQPVEDWRGLFEIRFTNLPHGHETAFDTPFTQYDRVDTTVVDSTSPGAGLATVRHGAIIIERAHIDWIAREELTLRAGLILTPFGIWNVDHGTPTLISLTFPAYQIVELWPTRQVGIEALGVFHLLPWELGYHLYVTNGRTAALVDVSDDKLIGGRVFLRTRRPVPFTFGISAFAGSNRDDVKTLDDPGTSAVERETTVAFDEQGVAADVSVDVGDLRLRAEAVFHQVFYEQGLRGPRFTTGPSVLLGDGADRRDLGAYVLAAYRFPWGLEPFVFVDFMLWPTPLGDAIVIPSVGLNAHFSAATLLKLQYSYGRFFDTADHASEARADYLHFVAARLVMAF